MPISAELLLDIKADLGEGPLWDERKQLLYWVDINAHTVQIYDPQTGKNTAYDVGQTVGTVVLRESGGLMLALRDGFASFSPETGALEILADPESDKPNNRFNDGKCDPAGRFWAGTMHQKTLPNHGTLYRLDTDMTVQKMVEDVSISNGLVWTQDHKRMYYVDSHPATVTAYDYDIDSGAISNGQVAIVVPQEQGIPDGMALDEEGMLWIAHYDGSAVYRWNPITGKVLDSISLPVSRPTACAFGGKDLDTLFITSAINGLKPEKHAEEPFAGGLFVAKPGVTGTMTYRFKG